MSAPEGGTAGGAGTGAGPERTVFDLAGGQPFFDELVARFYRGVATDVLLRPLYPDDLEPPARHLALFLGQYWGGPTTYSDERGHPRLRMRHAPFVIGDGERDAWLRHMSVALRATAAERGLPADVEARIAEYLAMAADAMVNAG